ncbi:MAG: GTPase [Gaiellales bacterium]|nr:GTPase [Gaiellales bacterium]
MSGQGDFYDRASVIVEAGRGGDGCVSFRREKFVPKGGPDGGDGGAGGDVVLVADPDMRDLSAFRFRRHLRGRRGVHGEGGGKTGGNGEDVIVHVPLGTQVYDADGELPIADLAHAKARVVIARGGRGGRGNRRFTTAVRQAPRTAEVGEEGESCELELRLKMVCDAALLGFPNAGKSSLLRRISNATPKVADYPFTTLAPQLGTVELDDLRQLTVADVPGLLEGASDGVGLGHAFLAHLERASALVHVVAIDPEAGHALDDCRARYAAIYGELAAHGGGLAERPQIVVLNKLDLVDEAEGEALVQAFADAVVAGDLAPDAIVARDDQAVPYVLGLSCATGFGVAELRGALERVLAQARRAEPSVITGEEELADFLLYRPRARQRIFRLVRDDGIVRIAGREVVSLVDKLDLATPDGVRALSIELGRLGVIDALRHAGVKPGYEVAIGDERFEFALPPEEAVDDADESDDLEW